MSKFPYVAWFRDDISLPPIGETHEWVACFWIEADSEALALSWGNYLSSSYVTRNSTTFYHPT